MLNVSKWLIIEQQCTNAPADFVNSAGWKVEVVLYAATTEKILKSHSLK